jgi:membrane protein YqaA with SNARE-associated domain
MGSFVGRLRALAIMFGAPGLFLVTLLDSSVLSLPEIGDFLVVWMVVHHKQRMLLYVASATIGSLAGCLFMYYLGRKGGEALVRQRFAGPRVERAAAAVRRHGMMAVLIPSVLPPPAPFKIFVLLAGGAGIGLARFSAAVLIGRSARFLSLGLLAFEYGDRATAYLAEHGTEASIAAVAALSVGFALYLLWSKTRTPRADNRL